MLFLIGIYSILIESIIDFLSFFPKILYFKKNLKIYKSFIEINNLSIDLVENKIKVKKISNIMIVKNKIQMEFHNNDV
jgi:hypothetical protein